MNYKDDSGLKFLESAGVEVVQIEDPFDEEV
jgi:hypothetical protein